MVNVSLCYMSAYLTSHYLIKKAYSKIAILTISSQLAKLGTHLLIYNYSSGGLFLFLAVMDTVVSQIFLSN